MLHFCRLSLFLGQQIQQILVKHAILTIFTLKFLFRSFSLRYELIAQLQMNFQQICIKHITLTEWTFEFHFKTQRILINS